MECQVLYCPELGAKKRPGDYEETGHQGECSVKAGRVVRASGKLADCHWDRAGTMLPLVPAWMSYSFPAIWQVSSKEPCSKIQFQTAIAGNVRRKKSKNQKYHPKQ